MGRKPHTKPGPKQAALPTLQSPSTAFLSLFRSFFTTHPKKIQTKPTSVKNL